MFRQQLLAQLPRLRRFALGHCRSVADADDLVQMTVERALSRWRQWSGEGPLEYWLFSILRNIWRDEGRRWKRMSDVIVAADAENSVESDSETSVYLDQMHHLITRLSDGQREALLLVCVEGMSYKETAAVLDIPVGTVMSRLARARATLMEMSGEVKNVS